MAEIKNGFLISARSKVGGTVLYRAKGEQLMRGVPVYPKDYVGSDAQISARDLFADMSSILGSRPEFCSQMQQFNRLIGRRYRGTYRDQLLGRMVGNLYTDENGVPHTAPARTEWLKEAKANPVSWMMRNARPPMFKQVFIQGLQVQRNSLGAGGYELVVNFYGYDFSAAIRRLRQSGYPRLTDGKVGVLEWGTGATRKGMSTDYPGWTLSTMTVKSGLNQFAGGGTDHNDLITMEGSAGMVLLGVTEANTTSSTSVKATDYVPLVSIWGEDFRLFY